MSIFTGIIMYFLIFWVTLFAVLPWGNKAPDVKEAGVSGGAPENPRIKQKFLITFVISGVIWGIIALLIHWGVVDFYEISRQMVKEDGLR